MFQLLKKVMLFPLMCNTLETLERNNFISPNILDILKHSLFAVSDYCL